MSDELVAFAVESTMSTKSTVFALFAFTIIFMDLFWHRIRLGELQNKVEQMKLQATI